MLKHYIVQALRSFQRFKITAAVNLLGLSLAVVCFVATYVFLDSLLRTGDRQFKNAARTYVLTQELWTTPTHRMIPGFPVVAPGAAKYLRADLPGLEAVARAVPLQSAAVAADDRAIYLLTAAVDPDFLKIFDLKPVEGELRDALSSTHGAIITANAARRLFGTARNVVGRSVIVQNRWPATIAAVIEAPPAGSHMGEAPSSFLAFELLLPMDFIKSYQGLATLGAVDPDDPNWGNDSYLTYVLLPANGRVSAAQLQETLRAFPSRHIPKDQIISVFGAVPLTRIKLELLQAFTSNQGVPLTTGAFVLDALILAIACLNYANLTVAVATTRAREVGMRKVLGASQPHLVRQYLVEAALLGTAALILVLIGTALSVPVIDRAFGLEFKASSLLQPGLWTLVIVLLAFISLAGGIYPAFVLARIRPVEALRAATVRAGPRFVPTFLVGIQFAAASFLLVVALLMSSQNRVLQRSGVHPERDPVVVMDTNVEQLGVPFETLRSELLRDPRIRSVSGALLRPWSSGGPHQSLRRTQDASTTAPVAMMNMITYDFFTTVGLPILAGRDFDRAHADPQFQWDSSRGGVPSVVLDRDLTRQLGWNRPADAVDQTIYLVSPWADNAPARPLHVVGVVENGYPRLVGPNADSNAYVLFPLGNSVPLVRIARDDIPGALSHIDATWKRLVPKVPIRRSFMDELFNSAYESFSILSDVATGLSGFAFVIAIMGLIAMAVYITSRRLREIAIRKTLGAGTLRLLLMMLRDFSRPVLIANLLAWPFAILAARAYFSIFMQRASISPGPFVLSLAITLTIAWLAVTAQASRAAAVKPAGILHMD